MPALAVTIGPAHGATRAELACPLAVASTTVSLLDAAAVVRQLATLEVSMPTPARSAVLTPPAASQVAA